MTVSMFQNFFFQPSRGNTQGIAPCMPEDEEGVGMKQAAKIRMVEQLLGVRMRTVADILFTVRGVRQDEVELLTGHRQLMNRGKGILNADVEQSRGQRCFHQV